MLACAGHDKHTSSFPLSDLPSCSRHDLEHFKLLMNAQYAHKMTDLYRAQAIPGSTFKRVYVDLHNHGSWSAQFAILHALQLCMQEWRNGFRREFIVRTCI